MQLKKQRAKECDLKIGIAGVLNFKERGRATAERPRAAGDTGGSSFSSLVRNRARQRLARSVAVSAAGSSPGAGRSATCAGSGNRRQRATRGSGSSAHVSVSGQWLASLGGEDEVDWCGGFGWIGVVDWIGAVEGLVKILGCLGFLFFWELLVSG
ncbi:hypothetical protein Droror1_Dr00013760 [Drosera rotundifolia]